MNHLYNFNAKFDSYRYLDGAVLATIGCELHLIKLHNGQVSNTVINKDPISPDYIVHRNPADNEIPYIIQNGDEIIFIEYSMERCLQVAIADFDYVKIVFFFLNF